jgi:L-ascorbate metabolism protein UlaG (beta-lactamase superfamily)
MDITWITQGGFIFSQSGRRLVVDPYLSDAVEKSLKWTRLVPAPVSAENIRPDTMFFSHNHIDHLDPATVLQIVDFNPLCRIIGPRSVTDDLVKLGVDSEKMTTLKPGMKTETAGYQLTAISAYHSDPYAIGLLIQCFQQTIYISGDSLYHPNLAQNVLDYGGRNIDLVLICINGQMNNMGIDEAVKVVKQIQPRIAAPFHYGLFAENTVDPEPFASKCIEIGIRPFLFTVGRPENLDKLFLGVENENC